MRGDDMSSMGPNVQASGPREIRESNPSNNTTAAEEILAAYSRTVIDHRKRRRKLGDAYVFAKRFA